MLRRFVLLALVVAGGCGPRHPVTNLPKGGGTDTKLEPAPPPPPGSIAVWGPMTIEAVDAVRSEVGWDRDLVRASRVVAYDVIVAQDRATCPDDAPPQRTPDQEGCPLVAAMPPTCKVETTRARIEVTVTYAIDVTHRCAGDAAPYALPDAGDVRAQLASASSACFRNRNKFKPEASWTSMYALTELQIGERPTSVTTAWPRLLVRALAPAGTQQAAACRDDGAYLDGTPGRPAQPTSNDIADAASTAIADGLAFRAPIGGEQSGIGLTNGLYRTEQALWEQCKVSSPETKSVVVAERCQLLRQLDRFVREVEDAARPETPKGNATSTTSAAPSASTAPSVKP
jgi:hypothetical protein